MNNDILATMDANGVVVDHYVCQPEAVNDESRDYFDQDEEPFGGEDLAKNIAHEVTSPRAAGLNANASSFEPSYIRQIPVQADIAANTEKCIETASLPPNGQHETSKKVTSFFGTVLPATMFVFGASLETRSFPPPVMTAGDNGDKVAVPSPSAPTIEKSADSIESGTYCGVCEKLITIDMMKHKDDCHGYCQTCNKEVSGDWTDGRFHYEDHKRKCPKTFKPQYGTEAFETPATTKLITDVQSGNTSQATTQASSSSHTPSTSDTMTKVSTCRLCHEKVVAPLILHKNGYEIGDFSQHNLTCTGKRTVIHFYCGNCGMAVTNKDTFFQKHKKQCKIEAAKKGELNTFNRNTGCKIGALEEGLPPTHPKVMSGTPVSSTGPRMSTGTPKGPRAGTPATRRGRILGSQTPKTPKFGATTTSVGAQGSSSAS
jgi:hypothetical protein